jgi:hypothetical protein
MAAPAFCAVSTDVQYSADSFVTVATSQQEGWDMPVSWLARQSLFVQMCSELLAGKILQPRTVEKCPTISLRASDIPALVLRMAQRRHP